MRNINGSKKANLQSSVSSPMRVKRSRKPSRQRRK